MVFFLNKNVFPTTKKILNTVFKVSFASERTVNTTFAVYDLKFFYAPEKILQVYLTIFVSCNAMHNEYFEKDGMPKNILHK